ncbi:MAG: hypothetical protein V1918_03760 [Planctomycetota bacterium]
MTDETKPVESGAQADAPAVGTARRRGLRLLKLYLVLYGLCCAAYFVHAFTGKKTVEIAALRAGDRLWESLSFTSPHGPVELAAGTTLSPAMQSTIEEARHTEDLGGGIGIFKEGLYHRFPWIGFFNAWNVLGLALVLYTFLGDWLPKTLQDHGLRIGEELAEAREAQARAQEIKGEYETLQKALREEEERLRAKGAAEVAEEQNRLLSRTREDMERMRAALERHLEAQVQIAADRLRAAVAVEAVSLARQRLAESLDEAAQRQLVERFIEHAKDKQPS